MHVRSCKRIKELFTVKGLCLLYVLEGGVEYTCAPKVFFTRPYGYVVNQIGDDTSGRTWRVHTSEQEVIAIPELRCLPNLEYDVLNNNTVDEYWPIRVMVRDQKVLMTFLRVAFSKERSETKFLKNSSS